MSLTASEFIFALCVEEAARKRTLESVVDLSLPLSPLALEQLLTSPQLRAQLMDRIAGKEKCAELPVDRLPFIGRAKLLSEARQQLLQGKRLLTLVGPHGSGKSRAARELLREASASGISTWHLACSQIESSDELAHEVALLLGDRDREHAYGQVMLDAVAPALRPGLKHILSQYPHLKFLITAHQAMRITGEAIVRVGYLSHSTAGDLLGAAAGDPAARSFLRVAPRLARLPLALVLAGTILGSEASAASPWLFPKEELIQKLTSQESIVMEAIGRLDNSALARLVCISTLQGPFHRADAEEVVREFGEADAHVEPFVGLSLVENAGAADTFVLHDEVKARVQEVVSRRGFSKWLAAAADAHGRVFARRAQDVADAMSSGHWSRGMSLLSQSRANCRAALRHFGSERHFDGVKRIATAMSRGLFEAGYISDFREFARLGMEAALSTSDRRAELELLGLSGALAGRFSDEESATNLWERRLSIALEEGDLPTASDALEDLAHQAFCLGDFLRAEGLANRSLQLSSTSGHLGHTATALAILARVQHALGNDEDVEHLVGQIRGLIPQCEDKALLPFIWYCFGQLLLDLGRNGEAEDALRSLLVLGLEGERVVGIGWALRKLGPLHEARHDTAGAARCYVASCAVHNEYATRHLDAARAALREFEDRHGLGVFDLISQAQEQPWRNLVRELLG